jgi:hypothetical protein
VRVGEGIKLVLNENAVRFNTNKSSLTSTKSKFNNFVFAEYPDTISLFMGIQIVLVQQIIT